MRKQGLKVALAIVALALGASGVAEAAAAPCLDGVVLLGFEEIKLEDGAQILSGSVIVNTDDPGKLEIKHGVTTPAGFDVKANQVKIEPNAVVASDLFYNTLDNKGTITGAVFTPLALPVFDDLPPFFTGPSNGPDVLVLPNETLTLAAGTYGKIKVEPDGTLILTGGVYNIQQLEAKQRTHVTFAAGAEVRVEKEVRVEDDATLGPDERADISAADIIFYIATGKAELKHDTTVAASFYVLNNVIKAETGAALRGAFIAKKIEIKQNVTVELDSFFDNQPPTAVAQEVQTDGANDLLIILQGSDPESSDLEFSIEVAPTEGTLGMITPITPAPVDQCSQSGDSCSVDADCPGFAGGETCETVQPPITQATVTYTPDAGGCVTEPSSGETTCPEDFFTFGVTDECGALATAIVSINGGTDEGPGDPGPGVDAVEANDLEVDAVVNQVKSLALSAAAPTGVASLTFRVESLPTGALQDSVGNPIAAVPYVLPDPVVVYQAPGTAGTDSFSFSAYDSTTSGSPCGPPSCDTGSVNIDVGNLPELAPDLAVGTDLNTPVEVTLAANSGGTGDGGGQEVPTGSLAVSQGDNGTLTAAQIQRAWARQGFGGPRVGTRAGSLGPTQLTVDGGWFQFSWCDVATSPNCDTLVDLVNAVEVNESPFDFTTSEASCLRITDTLAKGDHWRVEAAVVGSEADWTDFTSDVAQSTVGTTGDPSTAFGDATYSHGAFDLVGSGAYSVALTTIPPDSFAFGTAGFIRVDTGPCVDIVWTVTSLPANGTLTNPDGSAVQIGDSYVTQPTVIYTPTFNYTGPDTFNYEVAQNGTLGVNTVVDTAIVDLLVSANDPCVLVGRDPGCSAGLTLQEVVDDGAELAAPPSGPARGLTLVVEGIGGTVSAGPVAIAGGGVVAGLYCGAGDGECNRAFPAGSRVTLNARADGEHFEFLGWGGHCRGSEPVLTVLLDHATRCTALFGRKPGL